jgi:hypothetical protein
MSRRSRALARAVVTAVLDIAGGVEDTIVGFRGRNGA